MVDEKLRNAMVAFLGEWFSLGGKVAPSQESIERYVETGEIWFTEWFRMFHKQHGRYPSFSELNARRWNTIPDTPAEGTESI